MLSTVKRFSSRIRALFKREKLDRELSDELDTHLAMAIEEKQRCGMSPDEAERTARVEMGGMSQLREAHGEERGLPFFDTLLQDLRYSVRTFSRERSFTVFAILIAGLGIGASATVFSVVNALLLRPLPFKDPSQLVWIANDGPKGDRSGQTVPSEPYLEFRAQSRSLSDIAAYYAFYGQGDGKMTGEGEPERLTGVPVTQNFFSVLGVQPHIGRFFTPEESKRFTRVIVLSANFWARRFASDPNILGRKITLNSQAFTVIGVLPPQFDFASIFAPGTKADLFVCMTLDAGLNRQGNTLFMVGRLKPGARAKTADAEAAVLSEPIRIKYKRGALKFTVTPLEQHVRGELRPALFVLACAVGAVMLIVCANLANLQLARSTAKHKEFGIRAALGAGRWRLARQMLTESVLLTTGAAVLGVGVAIAATRFLAGLESISLPLRQDVRMDFAGLAFTIAIALATGLLFGVVPALRVPAGAVTESLKQTSRSLTGSQSQSWIRSSLVVAEIAFACVLLVGAGLLLRSFLHLVDVDLGFRPHRAAALRVDPSGQYNTQAKRSAYFDELLRRVHDVPGIDLAGLSDSLPLGVNRSWGVGVKGEVYSESHPPPDVFVRIVGEGYCPAMGIRLVAGRDLSASDIVSSKPVILINEDLAHKFWPNQNPIGKTVMADRDREVVGIVANVRHIALDQDSGYEMYIPMRQTDDYGSVVLVVRTSLSRQNLVSAIRSALTPIDPTIATNEFRMLQDIVDRSVSPRRVIVVLLTGFSIFALALASLGIYAVISYLVAQRTQEFGIRMALGASIHDVQMQVFGRTLRLALLGITIGAIGALTLTGILSSLLYGITATDPTTFAGVLLMLTVIALLAGYLPALRASKIHPMVALRAE